MTENFLSELLNIPPGCKEGVLFGEDGVTVLNGPEQSKEETKSDENHEDINIQGSINLEEVIDSNTHLVGK